ncbi:hypothetical protein [Francisella marina]|uniref:DUF1922 domain-containing protein n=1 Tax=Francisella marina TaxID=2249302 RepID=A0ABX5ZJM5_9GAMM|nr:hypothetical protein [Francisella marina]QEO57589.1 hypothetical protein F0R74_06875 [Francisella marina]
MSIEDLVKSKTIAIVCKNCGKKHDKSIAWVDSHTKLSCTCGDTTDLRTVNSSKVLRQVRKIDTEGKKLQSIFKKFNK